MSRSGPGRAVRPAAVGAGVAVANVVPMSEREYGISAGGRSAEEMYRTLTGAAPAPRAAIGDAVLEGHAVEIKRATSVTLNQVRAVKYIPLVAYDAKGDRWFVVPPHDVVRLVARKARGQHTENPFESATLSTTALSAFETAPKDLRAATLAAVASGERHPRVKRAMADILRGSRELAVESKAGVDEALRLDGIPAT